MEGIELHNEYLKLRREADSYATGIQQLEAVGEVDNANILRQKQRELEQKAAETLIQFIEWASRSGGLEGPESLKKKQLEREEAIKVIRKAFGSRPDLPPGEEYVRQIRSIWGGLLDRREDG